MTKHPRKTLAEGFLTGDVAQITWAYSLLSAGEPKTKRAGARRSEL